MLKIKRISLTVVIAIGFGALMISGASLAPAAFAKHQGISIKQKSEPQINACDSGAFCQNNPLNNANVSPDHSSVHIKQKIAPTNVCSGALCLNNALNIATVS